MSTKQKSRPVLWVCGVGGAVTPMEIVPTNAIALCPQIWDAWGGTLDPLAERTAREMAGEQLHGAEGTSMFADLWNASLSSFLPFGRREWTSEGVGYNPMGLVCFVDECSLSKLRWLFWQPWNGFSI